MAKKNLTVGPSGHKTWNVDRGGKTISTHRTQKTAVERAVPIAKRDKTDLIIKGRDGKIRSKDSYGQDPASIKDTEH
jgi:hypothetical protein